MTDRNAAWDIRERNEAFINALREEFQRFLDDLDWQFKRLYVVNAVGWAVTMALLIALFIRG